MARYTLIGVELDCTSLEVNEKLPLQTELKFVVVVILAPVIFFFNNAQPYDAVVNLSQGLVEPFIRIGFYHVVYIDRFQVTELDVQFRNIVKFLFHTCRHKS
jgi:hypothetical protein